MRGRVQELFSLHISSFIKISRGVSEPWRVENRPLPLTRPMAYIQQLVLPYKLLLYKPLQAVVISWCWYAFDGVQFGSVRQIKLALLALRRTAIYFYLITYLLVQAMGLVNGRWPVTTPTAPTDTPIFIKLQIYNQFADTTPHGTFQGAMST